jgi:Putative zinc-finger
MQPLEDWLRAAYAEEEAGCPPPEAFLAEETARLSPEERRRLEEHADRCPACAAERDLARMFDAGPAADTEGVLPEDVAFVVSHLEATSPVRPASKGKVVAFPTAAPKPVAKPPVRSTVWRLAAAVILVLGAGILFQLSRSGAPPLPTPGAGTVVRGGEVEAVAPVGEVAGIPSELRWEPRPGTVSYRVRLSTVDDTVLWETTVSAPPARLPAEVTGQLHRAVVYIWTVEALDASGARTAVSEPVRFRARPDPEEGAPL